MVDTRGSSCENSMHIYRGVELSVAAVKGVLGLNV